MDFSRLIWIGVALAAMFFGYFFGLFEGRGQGYKKRRAEEAGKEKQEILERISPPAESVSPAPLAPAVASDDPGILRLRDDRGQLRVELDGMHMSAESISQVQRKRLIEVVTRLRPWIEGRPSAGAPTPSPTPAPAPAAETPRPAPPPAAEMPRPAPSAAAVAPAAVVQPDEPAPARTTMVGQIDEILQKNIAGTPLADRGIRLMDAPGGGVTVFIGLQRYSSVGDVTDPEIQAALRAAISTWEKKYTPGL